jgi:hypothetical protein
LTLPELADALHTRASGTKKIVWLNCRQHIDLYDSETYVGQAVSATTDFLRRYL